VPVTQRYERRGGDTFGNALDDAALTRCIASLEHNDDLQSLFLNPTLELDQLHVQLEQFGLVFLIGKLGPVSIALDGLVFPGFRLVLGFLFRHFSLGSTSIESGQRRGH